MKKGLLLLGLLAFNVFGFEPPKVGQIVHYTSLQAVEDDGSPSIQPAIVTRIRSADGKTALHIFYPKGSFVKDDVPYAEGGKPGCWHLPQ